jgi:hypothetical protein
MSQRLKALEAANDRREIRAEQRDALVGAPPAEVIAAIVDPTLEIASYRLSSLFGNKAASVVPLVGPSKLADACREVARRHPHGRQVWHPYLRLRELNETERRRLIEALVKRGAPAWRTLLQDTAV